MREFGRESGTLPPPEKKLYLGLMDMQFPAVLRALLIALLSLLLTIYYHVLNSFPPPCICGSASETDDCTHFCIFFLIFQTLLGLYVIM